MTSKQELSVLREEVLKAQDIGDLVSAVSNIVTAMIEDAPCDHEHWAATFGIRRGGFRCHFCGMEVTD